MKFDFQEIISSPKLWLYAALVAWILFFVILSVNIFNFLLLPTGEFSPFWPESGFALLVAALVFGATAVEQIEARLQGLDFLGCDRIQSNQFESFTVRGVLEVAALCFNLISQIFFESSASERRQKLFYRALFTMLGVVSKSDGKVDLKEKIFASDNIAAKFELDELALKQAIHFFDQGSSLEANFDQLLQEFHDTFFSSPGVLRLFLDLLTDLAYVDGTLTANERRVLDTVVQKFGMRLKLRASTPATPQIKEHHSAFDLLGLEQSANTQQIQKAIRKLALEHNPARLVMLGVPKELEKEATKRFMVINEAYQQALKIRRGDS